MYGFIKKRVNSLIKFYWSRKKPDMQHYIFPTDELNCKCENLNAFVSCSILLEKPRLVPTISSIVPGTTGLVGLDCCHTLI